MPVAIATTVIAFLADAMKGLVGRALIALGIGAVTTIGFNVLINAALSAANQQIGNTGYTTFHTTFNAIGLPWFIGMLFSAISTRMVLKGLTSDALSFWVLRRGVPAS